MSMKTWRPSSARSISRWSRRYELTGLELYRRGTISTGKAAELLGMARLAFLQHVSQLGIPFFDMTEDEWAADQASLKDL